MSKIVRKNTKSFANIRNQVRKGRFCFYENIVGVPNFLPCPYRTEPYRSVFCLPYHDQFFEKRLPYRTAIHTKFLKRE